MSKRRIIGRFFSTYDTINGIRYEEVLQPFINSLEDDEFTLGLIVHMSMVIMNYVLHRKVIKIKIFTDLFFSK